jgi:cytochrome bd-type quinol oxidase subunit 2
MEEHSVHSPIAAITLTALLILGVSWIVLISIGNAPDEHEEAFARLQMVSALVTTGALLLLSFWKAPTTRSSLTKLWLAVVGLLVSAALGIFIVPLLALYHWFGFIDFEKYGPRTEAAWMLLTMAAVLFCILRALRK